MLETDVSVCLDCVHGPVLVDDDALTLLELVLTTEEKVVSTSQDVDTFVLDHGTDDTVTTEVVVCSMMVVVSMSEEDRYEDDSLLEESSPYGGGCGGGLS